MTLRSASLAAGLSLAAAFVLALPLAAEAGAARGGHMSSRTNCPPAHTAPHSSPRPAPMSGWGHSGGYPMHTGGYGHPVQHYPTHVVHYPTRYPNQGGYVRDNGYHRDYGHGLGNRGYANGNSYSITYAPTYDDSGYAGGGGYAQDYSGGYAAAPATDYVQQQDYSGDYVQPAPAPAQEYDSGYAYNDAQSYSDNYSDTSYQTTTYAPPPPPQYAPQYVPAPQPQYAPVPACACSQPVINGGGASAYGWRDQYGAWHVTSQNVTYSSSYSSGY